MTLPGTRIDTTPATATTPASPDASGPTEVMTVDAARHVAAPPSDALDVDGGAPGAQPSSIAPLALDVAAPPRTALTTVPSTTSATSASEETHPPFRDPLFAAPLAPRRGGGYVAACAAAGLALMAAIAVVAVIGRSAPVPSAPALAAPMHAPPPFARVLEPSGARSLDVDKPTLAPAKAGAFHGGPASGATGILVVSPLLGTILVDGVSQPARRGAVVLACGRHEVRAARSAQARAVDVPCGGRATF